MRLNSPRNASLHDLAPACASVISAETPAARGSPSRTFLSLQLVAQTLPSKSHTKSWISWSWHASDATSPPFSMSQTLTAKSPDTDPRMLFAVGWNRSSVTLRPWPWRSTSGSVNVSLRPPGGMPQTLMVESSEADAMMCSWNGLKSKSSTADLWPATMGELGANAPVFSYGTTANGPPPPWSATAKNCVLPLTYCCSPVTVASRNPLYVWSILGGST
mmetsp:Transcript_6121/g.19301  ORF Transcript_6121/g.19301 Transcript_6121/m.19301 type:complete len:218 (-) Transcript_6121:251-904(-)